MNLSRPPLPTSTLQCSLVVRALGSQRAESLKIYKDYILNMFAWWIIKLPSRAIKMTSGGMNLLIHFGYVFEIEICCNKPFVSNNKGQ